VRRHDSAHVRCGERQSAFGSRSVEIPGESCRARELCESRVSLEIITFEPESRVRRIEERCSLKSICIPRSVEILGKSCSAAHAVDEEDRASLNCLGMIAFEGQSTLRRIQEEFFSSLFIEVDRRSSLRC